MAGNFLKNTGRLITAVILLFFLYLPVFAAEIKSELTSNSIGEGESTVLRVMISGSTSDIRPLKVPTVNGLNINLSGTSRSFQFINGKSWTGIILSFTIQAEKKGVYRIPPFLIEADGDKLQTGEFVLTVDEGETGGIVPYGTLRGEVELTAADIYAGEPVIMRYYLRTGNSDITIEGMREQPESKGFVIKQIKEGGAAAGENSGDGRIYLASYCLVAAESGRHDIGGGLLSVAGETGRGFFSQVIRKEIRFPKKMINVKTLPSENRPKIFNGDVGEFTIQNGEITGSFREGEEIRIPVKVRGRGNLLMMSKVTVENQDGIKLLVEESDPVLSIDNRTLTGEKNYSVTIIPERAGDCNIGKIFLPYFNPYKGRYEQAESLPVSFTVSPAITGEKNEDEKTGVDKKNSWPMVILVASVILILACGAILYLQTGRYRIVKAESLHNKTSEPEPEAVDYNKTVHADFERFYAERNRESFLRKSEKLAGIIADNSRDNSVNDEIKNLREKINFYRYGGASFTDEDMKKIYEVIKKLS